MIKIIINEGEPSFICSSESYVPLPENFPEADYSLDTGQKCGLPSPNEPLIEGDPDNAPNMPISRPLPSFPGGPGDFSNPADDPANAPPDWQYPDYSALAPIPGGEEYDYGSNLGTRPPSHNVIRAMTLQIDNQCAHEATLFWSSVGNIFRLERQPWSEGGPSEGAWQQIYEGSGISYNQGSDAGEPVWGGRFYYRAHSDILGYSDVLAASFIPLIQQSATTNCGSIFFSWQPIPGMEATIFRDGSPIATLPAGDTSYTDSPGTGTFSYSLGFDMGGSCEKISGATAFSLDGGLPAGSEIERECVDVAGTKYTRIIRSDGDCGTYTEDILGCTCSNASWVAVSGGQSWFVRGRNEPGDYTPYQDGWIVEDIISLPAGSGVVCVQDLKIRVVFANSTDWSCTNDQGTRTNQDIVEWSQSGDQLTISWYAAKHSTGFDHARCHTIEEILIGGWT